MVLTSTYWCAWCLPPCPSLAALPCPSVMLQEAQVSLTKLSWLWQGSAQFSQPCATWIPPYCWLHPTVPRLCCPGQLHGVLCCRGWWLCLNRLTSGWMVSHSSLVSHFSSFKCYGRIDQLFSFPSCSGFCGSPKAVAEGCRPTETFWLGSEWKHKAQNLRSGIGKLVSLWIPYRDKSFELH